MPFQNTALSIIHFFYCLLEVENSKKKNTKNTFFLLSFISALIFITSFLLLTLDFVLFLFPLNRKLEGFFYIFLVSRGRLIPPLNSLLEMFFSACHRFWKDMFVFSFISRFLNILLWVCHYPFCFSVAYCLISTFLIFPVFFLQ